MPVSAQRDGGGDLPGGGERPGLETEARDGQTGPMTSPAPPPPSPAVVTGATGGLGRYVALGLAKAGCQVVLVGRDPGRSEAARAWISGLVPGAPLEVEIADLSSLAQARDLGARIAARHPRVGLLVNNAGVFEARPVTTAEGFDRVLAVNLLSPMVLTEALLPRLLAGAPARIVNIGSSSSDRARLDPERLELGRRWSMVAAYGQSKLALMMASFALAERLQGTGVSVNVVHPGLVATGLVRTGGIIGAAWRLIAAAALTEEQGADTPLYAALDPAFARLSGVYVKKRRAVRPNPQASDRAQVARVWAEVRRLAGPWLPAPSA